MTNKTDDVEGKAMRGGWAMRCHTFIFSSHSLLLTHSFVYCLSHALSLASLLFVPIIYRLGRHLRPRIRRVLSVRHISPERSTPPCARTQTCTEGVLRTNSAPASFLSLAMTILLIIRKPTGPIETTRCDYETIESVNNVLYDQLHELVQTPFFKYFRVRQQSPSRSHVKLISTTLLL
jgi:hypothetical protein